MAFSWPSKNRSRGSSLWIIIARMVAVAWPKPRSDAVFFFCKIAARYMWQVMPLVLLVVVPAGISRVAQVVEVAACES